MLDRGELCPTGRYARRKRLDEMLGHMKERIGGKIGNQNNNAFKLRKLFAMYDTGKTGLVRGPGRSRPLRTWYHHWCNCALTEQGNNDVRRRCKAYLALIRSCGLAHPGAMPVSRTPPTAGSLCHRINLSSAAPLRLPHCTACWRCHIALEQLFVCAQVSVEAFRVMTESFGMQLDDDSLLALFHRVCTLCAPA